MIKSILVLLSILFSVNGFSATVSIVHVEGRDTKAVSFKNCAAESKVSYMLDLDSGIANCKSPKFTKIENFQVSSRVYGNLMEITINKKNLTLSFHYSAQIKIPNIDQPAQQFMANQILKCLQDFRDGKNESFILTDGLNASILCGRTTDTSDTY